MSADYGADVSTFPDLDPTFSTRSDGRVVVEACARRLLTPTGSMFFDDAFAGTDLRQWLNASTNDLAGIQSAVRRECLKDERVLDATVYARFTDADRFAVTVTLQLADGPFAFTLDVLQVSVTLLHGRGV